MLYQGALNFFSSVGRLTVIKLGIPKGAHIDGNMLFLFSYSY